MWVVCMYGLILINYYMHHKYVAAEGDYAVVSKSSLISKCGITNQTAINKTDMRFWPRLM